MDTYITMPLELRRKKLQNQWRTMDYECIALVDDNSKTIKKIIFDLLKCIVNKNNIAYVVIWFFDFGTSQEYYLELFRNIKLIKNNRDLLIYKIEDVMDFEKILTCWGDFDVLDVVFPKDMYMNERIFCTELYDNYKDYRKGFVKRASISKLIISDSGDGNEAQIVYSNKAENHIKQNILMML